MEKLRIYLTINAVFSQLSGILAITLSLKLNNIFDISNEYVLPFIGFNLLVFSIFVLVVARKFLTNKTLVKWISFLDILWVVGSLLIVAFGLFGLSTSGYVVITVLATWIGFLAFKQITYNK
jgi:hypothetical protein